MLLEVTPERWLAHQDRCRRKRKELPLEVFIGGDRFVFDPQCEVPDNLALRALKYRKYLQKVEQVVEEPQEENPLECKYCGKVLKSLAGRKSHERHCKEK